jgi:hypothetical protein
MRLFTRWKKSRAFLGLILAGCCLGLLLAEGAVRIFYPHARDHVVPAGLLSFDDDLGWKLQPGKTVSHHTRYFTTVYATNSLGFRDPARAVTKGPATYRILLFGDSQIFGWGVPAEERFSHVIEENRKELEVWNLGVPGYGLDQEILAYERSGQSLNADNAIFFVSSSTLARIHTQHIFAKYKPMFQMDPEGNLKLIPVPKVKNAAAGWLYRIVSPFYLPYFLEFELTKFEEAKNRQPRTRSLAIGDFEKKLLLRAKEVARERGQVVTILTDFPRASREDFRRFCDQNGIRFIGIDLEAYPKEDIVFGPFDAHWNVKANRLIQEQVLPHLER